MEWLKAVEWDHPAVVAASGAAVGGIFLITAAILKRRKPPDGGATNINTNVNPEINVSPQTNIENNPSNVFEPTVKVGLDEKDVGQELDKRVDPLRHQIKALSEQLAAQLAPKQPVPVSDDLLMVYAVEFFNAGVDANDKGEIGQALGHWFDALKLEPDYAYAHNNVGVVLAIKGELEAAIEHYNTALRLDPDYTTTHFNLGCALAQKKDAAGAVAALAKAIELDSKFREMAKTDTDFDPIRDDPAFRKLVDGE